MSRKKEHMTHSDFRPALLSYLLGFIFGVKLPNI